MGVDVGTVKFSNIMLNEGTTAKPYEPYGVSPSPEYLVKLRALDIQIYLKESLDKEIYLEK